MIFNDEFPILAETKFQERHLLDFIRLFPEYANTMVTDKIIIENPKTFWDLLNVGTNILTHKMNRNMDSTHNLEGKLYPKVKKMALKEAKVAVA
jgi:DNA anti-recombination protein RmuC